ncbi:MAG: site-specific integrase [Ruminococcus flavefaciens]|nr:site-specific integrase [Ruminococcus flavefaciens]
MPKQGKNIYLRKDGRWEGRYIKERVNGKARYGYVFGKSYEEASNKLVQATCQSIDTQNLPSTTFGAISSEWLTVQTPELKASSVARYRNLLNSYILPQFSKRIIQEIQRSEIVVFSRDLLTSGGAHSQGLAPKTVNSVLSVLKNVFTYASIEKSILVADIKDISVKQPLKPMRILSKGEQKALSEYLCSDPTPCHIGILLSLYTGLRIGEVCALRWKDICVEEQYLYIHQTMQRIQVEGDGKKRTEVVILPPKSDCSVRRIPIPDEVLRLLKTVQRQDDAFLLTGLVHSYIEPRCLENRFKAVTQKCGLTGVNYHALRHTFATRCVELGFDIKSLSEILGHASVNITLNRYVHPSMDLKQQNMNLLSGLLTTK